MTTSTRLPAPRSVNSGQSSKSLRAKRRGSRGAASSRPVRNRRPAAVTRKGYSLASAESSAAISLPFHPQAGISVPKAVTAAQGSRLGSATSSASTRLGARRARQQPRARKLSLWFPKGGPRPGPGGASSPPPPPPGGGRGGRAAGGRKKTLLGSPGGAPGGGGRGPPAPAGRLPGASPR